jgi:HlyD family secretion protein
MKRIIIGAVIIVVLVVAALLLFTGKGGGVEYMTEPVTRGDVVQSVSATGTVNPVTTVNVGTQVSGKIMALYADYNSVVKKGELIAQIDPTLFQAAVDQAKANLANAKATLAKNQATLADALRTRDRYRDLLARHLVSQSDLDTAETAYLTAKATVDSSETQIAQAQAALNQAQTNLFYTRIVSPVDGTVISRNVDVGQTVAATFQTPTLFTIAVDLTKMQVDTSVDEADIGGIETGQDADFTVDAFPDDTFHGTVFQVRNAATVVQNVVTYDVVIKVSNPELKLRPGMTANVDIITARARNVLRIPNAALRFLPPQAAARPAGPVQATAGALEAQPRGPRGPSVWVLENGQPKRVPVKIGISDGNNTELLEGDLKAGEPVITEAMSKAKSRTSAGPRFF